MRIKRRAAVTGLLGAGLAGIPPGRAAWSLSLIPPRLIRFHAGSAELDVDAQRALQGMAATAHSLPELSLRATGYADAEELGRHRLSLARATACAVFLQLNGVDEGRVVARAGDLQTLLSITRIGGFAEQNQIALVDWIEPRLPARPG